MALPSEEIKEKLDVVQVLREYLDLKPAGRNFKALCPFHQEKTSSFVVSPERQIWHCFGCFPPGQKIKTPFGYHNIEDLDEDHYVYSASGNIRKILATHKRHYEGEVVNIKVRKLSETVSLTVDHKLKIIRPKTQYYKKSKQFYRQVRNYDSLKIEDLDLLRTFIEKKGEKIEITAGELKIGDFVMYPINDHIADLEKLNLKNFLQKSYRFGPIPAKIPYEVKVNQDFLKLIGYYIAEGSNHRAYIRFSLGNHEKEFANEIVGLIKTVFGLTAKIHERAGGKNGLEVTACHSFLANIFENLCGKGANQKHAPFFFNELPPNKQMVLLKAVHRGDGHSYIAKKSFKKHNAITTVSRVLAEQIVDFLLRNNFFPSLSVSKAKIDKLNVSHKEAYTINWSEEAISQHSLVYKDVEGSRYWLLPIRETKRESYRGTVYNLTVDKDHSYVTTNFAVANCGEGGDIFKFLMKYENIEFYEALKILAEKAGVELKKLSPIDQKQFGILYDINDAVTRFWSESLKISPRPQEYLRTRGLKKETVTEFELGFAPNGFDVSTVYLIKEGFNIEDIVRAGLSFKTEKGKYIDRFRGRVMFPIHNHFGKIVGFSGRILPEFENSEVGKYVNSPETPIFNKSRLLYGFFKAKNFIRERKTVLIVEGQMDFLMLWQAGINNLAATSGTALTVDHLKVLQKLADNIVVTFDKDEAGMLATERAIDLAHAADFSAFVFDFGEFKDPAEAAEKRPEFIREIAKTPTPAMEYYLKRYLSHKDGVHAKTDIMVVLGKIKNIWNHVEQASWIRELSHKVGLPVKDLTEELERIEEGEVNRSFGEQIVTPVQSGKGELTRMDNIILRILSLTSIKEGLYILSSDELDFLPLKYRNVYLALNHSENSGLDRETRALLDMISLRSGLETEFIDLPADQIEKIVKEELGKLLRELELEYWKEKRRVISKEISRSEENGSVGDIIMKLKEFDDVSKKIHYIDNDKKD